MQENKNNDDSYSIKAFILVLALIVGVGAVVANPTFMTVCVAISAVVIFYTLVQILFD